MTTFEIVLLVLNLALAGGNVWLAYWSHRRRKECEKLLAEVVRLNQDTARMMDRLS